MKRALVLSGGGSRGAFEVGAVEYLICEAGLDFSIFLGTSAGALNVAMLAQARNYRELIEQTRKLKELWLNIKGNYSIYRRNVWGILNLLFHNALYNPKGLRNLLKKYIDPSRLCNNPTKFMKVGTVAIETGELFFADSRRSNLVPQILDYILASASIPFFFPPVCLNGKHWHDGGLRDITPLGAAFSENPDEIYVILTFPVNQQLEPVLSEVPYRGVFKALLRALNILTTEISANDLQLAQTINQYYQIFPGTRRVPIRIIAPEKFLAGDTLDFEPEFIRKNIKEGYDTARNLLSLNSKSSISNSFFKKATLRWS